MRNKKGNATSQNKIKSMCSNKNDGPIPKIMQLFYVRKRIMMIQLVPLIMASAKKMVENPSSLTQLTCDLMGYIMYIWSN